MRTIHLLCTGLLVLDLSAQSWSHDITTYGQVSAVGLQNNDVLVCLFSTSSGSCSITRLDPYGDPIWSGEFHPAVRAAWGALETSSGDLLCCVHVPDPLDTTVFVNGILRLTPTGTVVRLDILRSAPRDVSNPYASYLVQHADDDEYHFVYQNSSGNDAKVYWMSSIDDVLGTVRVTSNFLPAMSMTEHHGALYGVALNRIGKLAYDGSLQWLLQTSTGFPAHHMYEIKSEGNELYVRYQFDVGTARRPAVAVFDTTGQLQRDLVLDFAGTGTPSECQMIIQGSDIIIGAERNDTYETMVFRMDTALTTWAAWEDDRVYSNLYDCRPAGTGAVLSGLNSQNSHRFVSRSGPGGEFAACWTVLSVDTLMRPWPVPAPIGQNTVTFDPLLVQTTVTPMPHTYAAGTDCIALGADAEPIRAGVVPQVMVDGSTIVITATGGGATEATLLDMAGSVVRVASVVNRATLDAPAAGCYVVLLRTPVSVNAVSVVVPR